MMEENLFEICGVKVERGTISRLRLKISEYFTSFPAYIPIIVIRGITDGLRLFVTGAIHGNELNGIEIVRRITTKVNPKKLSGTLICVPIVNIFGFYNSSRLLPDRRDLNNHFPGSVDGSSASRIAYTLFNEVILKCHYGVDIHTQYNLESNVPYIVGNLKNMETKRIAEAFGTPVIIDSNGEKDSLLRESEECGITTILYKGGQRRRFDKKMIEIGYNGIINVLNELDMLKIKRKRNVKSKPLIVHKQTSVYTNRGGILNLLVKSGDIIKKGRKIAVVVNPFGREIEKIYSPVTAMIIGLSVNPLVNPGGIVCQLAKISKQNK
jgi:predicted deacylase